MLLNGIALSEWSAVLKTAIDRLVGERRILVAACQKWNANFWDEAAVDGGHDGQPVPNEQAT